MVERSPNILASEEKATISMEPTFALAVDIDLQNPGFRLYHAVCPSVCLPLCLSVRLCVMSLPIHLSAALSTVPVLRPSCARPPLGPYACVSVCVFVCRTVSLMFWCLAFCRSIHIYYVCRFICPHVYQPAFSPQKNPPDFSCVGCC